MTIRLHLLALPLLYIFTVSAFAHPGPHSHTGLSEGNWHAFFGWEFGLAGFIAAGGAWFLLYRLRNTRPK